MNMRIQLLQVLLVGMTMTPAPTAALEYAKLEQNPAWFIDEKCCAYVVPGSGFVQGELCELNGG